MKYFKIFTLIFSLSFSSVIASTPKDAVKGEVSGKYKNLFVFKADKKFLGAKIEILSTSGELITSQSLLKRKMVIDFGGVKFGTYIIRVSKGNDVQEFQYIKNS
jgi:hypothetical protein